MQLHLQIQDNGFFLLDQSNLVASFTYNTASSSFRLNAWSKRLFFLEEKGFLRKKVVLKTEYGVEIGECHFIRNAQNGIIYLNDRKFVFNGDNSEIRIADKQNNLVHCKLQQ